MKLAFALVGVIGTALIVYQAAQLLALVNGYINSNLYSPHSLNDTKNWWGRA